MQQHELVDVMRRAMKLVAEHTTDLAEAERLEPASHYTDPDRFTREREIVRAAPQLVGYASELPAPNTYVVKDVMGTPVLLTRAKDGRVRAFHNICRHRQAPIATGCGAAQRLACPYHAWTYDLTGNVVGVPGDEGFTSEHSTETRLPELPAAEDAGFLWVGLESGTTLDVAAHLGELGPELASWGFESWHPVGEKQLDARIDWKLALDTFAENYHFATVHATTFATVALSNCTVFDSFGHHHRLVFPLRSIDDVRDVPEDQWKPLERLVVIYALFPNIVVSVTAVNGEIFRVYPGAMPGESRTFHQNAWRHPLDTEEARAGAEAVFDYAHHTVRDEDYALAARVQANLETGLSSHLVFGRNEPGLQHRHATVTEALHHFETQGEPQP
ncbi:MAG TPA: SRPBCC family protein [Mycobacteriales bacterium]|nr:SRPBCC family protein [Mycobacteriales bacterium]